ncbi:MAG: molybdenum cofactor biosynthesis protein MoaE [Rubrimonas sp.]
MAVRVQEAAFDTGAEIAAAGAGNHDVGAVVSFTGRVRDMGGGAEQAMTLEHYPGMTEAELQRIEAEAHRRWPLAATTIVHRVGRLRPGEPIVLVIAASRHRRAAFEAAEFLMDYLKTRAPFWKKEETAEGATWVDARESDDESAARWGG